MSFKCFKYIKKRVKYYEFGVFGVYKKRTTWKPKHLLWQQLQYNNCYIK